MELEKRSWGYSHRLGVSAGCAAGDLVEKKMTEISAKMKQGQLVEGEYLTHLLVSEQMSVSEVLGSITELLLAGVDTVRRWSLPYPGGVLHFTVLLDIHCIYSWSLISKVPTDTFQIRSGRRWRTISRQTVMCVTSLRMALGSRSLDSISVLPALP